MEGLTSCGDYRFLITSPITLLATSKHHPLIKIKPSALRRVKREPRVYVYKIGVIPNVFCCPPKIYEWSNFLTKKKLFITIEELFNVVLLVGVENVSFDRFARYRRKINILLCYRF